MENEAMVPGPCVLCGDTNYPLSYGGPTICPACDVGRPNVGRMKRQLDSLLAENKEMREALQAALDTWQQVHELTEVDGYHDHWINKIRAALATERKS